MWYELLMPIGIICGAVMAPGYVLYNCHNWILGNLHLYSKMWYEILPSFCIIVAGVGLPGWGLYHIHNLVVGNHFRRTMIDRWDRHAYQRDYRLTGNPYNVHGLEQIPDEK